VIRNFKDKEAESIFNRQRSRRLPPQIQQAALRKLRMFTIFALFDPTSGADAHWWQPLPLV